MNSWCTQPVYTQARPKSAWRRELGTQSHPKLWSDLQLLAAEKIRVYPKSVAPGKSAILQ